MRVRSGNTLVSDGPFAEAKEVIAGFDLIDCADEAEALEIAAKHPVARFGAVEVRALWPDESVAARHIAGRPRRCRAGAGRATRGSRAFDALQPVP